MGPWPILLMVRKLDHGGCERDLTKVALGIDRNRFEPHVGCFRPEGLRVGELQRGGVPIVAFPVMSFRSRSAVEGALKMRRYIQNHRIRLVHSYDGPTALYATPVARACRVPAVLISQLSYRSLHTPGERRLLRAADRLAHGIVVNCLAMRRHMIEEEGAAADRLRLCYNGVDTSIFHPGASLRPPGLREAQAVVGTVANLRKEKGVDLLLRAFAKIRRKAGALKCYIVGSGPCEEELRSLAGNLGIADDCVFQPGRPDIAEDMRWIDIFALPSRSEAFSNALLEAMASGCAVIGSNVGGTPELITDGESGLLFRPEAVDDLAERIDRLVQDTKLRKRLGASARCTGEKFSLARNLNCFESLYTSFLERNG